MTKTIKLQRGRKFGGFLTFTTRLAIRQDAGYTPEAFGICFGAHVGRRYFMFSANRFAVWSAGLTWRA